MHKTAPNVHFHDITWPRIVTIKVMHYPVAKPGGKYLTLLGICYYKARRRQKFVGSNAKRTKRRDAPSTRGNGLCCHSERNIQSRSSRGAHLLYWPSR